MEYDFSKIVISTAPAFEDFDLINGDLATLDLNHPFENIARQMDEVIVKWTGISGLKA